MTASAGTGELSAFVMATGSVMEPVRMVRFSCGTREVGVRTRAVMVWFLERAWVIIWRPVRPLPPRMRMCILRWLFLLSVAVVEEC